MITDPQPLANPRIRDVIAERVSQEAQLGWLFEHEITVKDREATLRAVFLNGHPRWRSAFAVMLLLASRVATSGWSQNSVATIIGAMVIPALDQPIVAIGAAVAMA